MELRTYAKPYLPNYSPSQNFARNVAFTPLKGVNAPNQPHYILPTVFNKYISTRVNPVISMHPRAASTTPVRKLNDSGTKSESQYYNQTFDRADEKGSLMMLNDGKNAKPRKSVLETLKRMLGDFSAKPEEKQGLNLSSTSSQDTSFRSHHTYGNVSDYIYPDYLGYMPKCSREITWNYGEKRESGKESKNLSMYIRLPAIVYPVNEFPKKSKSGPAPSGDTKPTLSLNEELKKAILSKPRPMRDYAFGSKAGQATAVRLKENQDSAVIEANFGKDGNAHFFAIADGHGVFGHKVSFFAKLAFPSIVFAHFQDTSRSSC